MPKGGGTDDLNAAVEGAFTQIDESQFSDFSGGLGRTSTNIGALTMSVEITGALNGLCETGDCNPAVGGDSQDSLVFAIPEGQMATAITISVTDVTGVIDTFSLSVTAFGEDGARQNLGQINEPATAGREAAFIDANQSPQTLASGAYGLSVFGQGAASPGAYTLSYTVRITIDGDAPSPPPPEPDPVSEDDVIVGTPMADRLDGLAGDDTITPGAGADTVDGGADTDTIIFMVGSSEASFGRNGEDLAITIAGETNIVRNVERFVFSDQELSEAEVAGLIPSPDDFSGPDKLVGSNEAEVFDTSDGADSIRALGGDDTISAGRGADTVEGGRGNDLISGQGGRDSLLGGGGRDTIMGGGGRDTLIGGGGRDEINGGGGRDQVEGRGGRDSLIGGGGADTLLGGGGADTLSGGRGLDMLEGGRARDIFQFQRGDGLNVITDFRQGQDRIEILDDGLGFDDLTIVNQGDDVLIRYLNVRIRILDSDQDQFSSADFIGLNDLL